MGNNDGSHDVTDNGDATDNGATSDGAEEQNVGDNASDGLIDGGAPNGDNDDPEDDNNYPKSEEDLSLGPDEFDIPEEPVDVAPESQIRGSLVSSSKSSGGGSICGALCTSFGDQTL